VVDGEAGCEVAAPAPPTAPPERGSRKGRGRVEGAGNIIRFIHWTRVEDMGTGVARGLVGACVRWSVASPA